MSMEVLFAGVRVRELARAIAWYSALFGRVPDVVPHDSEVMWRVSDGGWLYVIEDCDRAGASLVTIAVTDLQRELHQVRDRGVPFGSIESVGDAALKATSEDPDGNSIALIQVA